MEENFECSGICQPPLFYITQDLKLGPPENSCFQKISQSLGEQMFMVGIVVGASAVLMLFMICCSYPIWGYSYKKWLDEIAIE